MKTEALSAILGKAVIGVAASVTVAGGGAIISSARTNAVQDNRLQTVEANFEKIDKLSEQLTTTNQNIALLQQRLDQEVKYRESSD